MHSLERNCTHLLPKNLIALLFVYIADPCDMMLSCLACIKRGFIFAELANNGSQCCFKDFYSVTEPVTFATNNPGDCPPSDDGIRAMTYGKHKSFLLSSKRILCIFLFEYTSNFLHADSCVRLFSCYLVRQFSCMVVPLCATILLQLFLFLLGAKNFLQPSATVLLHFCA